MPLSSYVDHTAYPIPEAARAATSPQVLEQPGQWAEPLRPDQLIEDSATGQQLPVPLQLPPTQPDSMAPRASAGESGRTSDKHQQSEESADDSFSEDEVLPDKVNKLALEHFARMLPAPKVNISKASQEDKGAKVSNNSLVHEVEFEGQAYTRIQGTNIYVTNLEKQPLVQEALERLRKSESFIIKEALSEISNFSEEGSVSIFIVEGAETSLGNYAYVAQSDDLKNTGLSGDYIMVAGDADLSIGLLLAHELTHLCPALGWAVSDPEIIASVGRELGLLGVIPINKIKYQNWIESGPRIPTQRIRYTLML